MDAAHDTTTISTTVLTCRPFFRVLAAILCVLSVVGSVGLVLGGLHDAPEMLLALIAVVPTAWLSGLLALRGTVEIGRTVTTETTRRVEQ